MFACKLCNDVLQQSRGIVGTYCGHAFHQKCLSTHLNKVSTCPTCKKSLKVNMALIATLSHDFATLPLYLEECNSRRIDSDEHRSLVNENTILRQKLVELAQALIVLQDGKKNAQKSKTIIYDDTFHDNNYEKPPTGVSITRTFKEQLLPYKADSTIKTESYLSESAKDIAQWTCTTQSVSEIEKERTRRSKRREYLTWRNKVHTWLSKMEKASDKLLRAEAYFTPQEYLNELHLFFDKLSLQGEIVETAKEASLVYLIIGQLSETEKETVQVSMQFVTTMFEDMKTKIIDKLSKLDRNVETLNAALIYQHDLMNHESVKDFRPTFESNKQRTRTKNEVSQYPKYYFKEILKTQSALAGVDLDISFRDPVFV